MLELLAAWLVTAMVQWVPPKAEEDRLRYESMARDFAAVALDEAEVSPFSGADGRPKTALLMAAIASYESGYLPQVDNGTVRGSGRDLCIMQVRIWGRTEEGWTADDIARDRQKCLRVALHRIQYSFEWCKAKDPADWLSGYTTGRCRDNEKHSRVRVWRAKSYWRAHPFVAESPRTVPSEPPVEPESDSPSLTFLKPPLREPRTRPIALR